jgi:GWxTD domain-containing protein
MRRGLATVALLLAAALATGCAVDLAATPAAGALNNPFLGLDWSSWLVGPISVLATAEEEQAYLALRDDAAAERFVEGFWQRRDPDPATPGNPRRELFEERVPEADRRFSEAGYLGRRTDRGTVFVLYGEPEKVDYELARREGEPPIEVWTYARDAAPGLTGRQPAVIYRFVPSGDLTVLYRGPGADRSVFDASPRP